MTRRRWNLSAIKLPAELRTTAHAVITDDDDRGYRNIRGADDSGTAVQAAALGDTVVYSLLLTDDEAAEFARASNLEWIEPDQTLSLPEPVDVEPLRTTTAQIPSDSARRFMGAAVPGWRGDGIKVAVLDGGVSTPVLTAIGCPRIAARNFSGVTLVDGTTAEHGCWVASCALTPGMELIDGVICDREGRSTHSAGAAAMIWAAGLGARVIVFSHGSSTGSRTMEDTLRVLGEHDAVLVAAAGNDGGPLNHPAAYCDRYPHVVAAIAHDDATGTRPAWASHAEAPGAAVGAAPGVRVPAYGRDGQVDLVSGSSFAGPHTAWMIGRLLTGGRWTPLQVVTALIATARDTPEAPEHEGRGAWDMQAAVARLESLAEPAPDIPPVVDPPEPPPLRATEPRGCWSIIMRAFRG